MSKPRQDRADAGLICEVAAALRGWEERTGSRAATKILRKAVWFFWQSPRLAGPLVASKYPRGAPWSDAAAAIVLDGAPLRGRLVIEHLEPMSRTLRWLIEDTPDTSSILEELPTRLSCAVITKAESARLPDDGTPEERYRRGGLDLSVFRPLDER